MEGEDLAITVLTCEGDIADPSFPFKLQHLVAKLQRLISDEKKPIKVTKVEPWNSVRVTFNIPQEAAQRLRQLAERGDRVLRELGILSVQIEGDQVITLTLAGQFNEPQEIVLRKTTENQNDVTSVSFNLPNSEPVPGPSSAEPTHKNISQFLGHIVGGAAAATAAVNSSARLERPDLPVKQDPAVSFRSPNVIAPTSTEPIPFLPAPAAATTTIAPTGTLRAAPSVPAKTQTGFGPFPFASMTHAMNTKHGSSSPQYQPVIQVQGTNSRLSFTTASTQLTTASRNSFSNTNVTSTAVARPQTVSSPLQKVPRTLTNPLFNNIVSRVTAPNSIASTSRANVALSSPLLVNLLQSEPSNLQAHNKLMPPPALASNQAPKRKRKPRKPKEKTLEDGNMPSPTFSTSPSPPSQSHVGMRSPVGLDSLSTLGQPFNIPLANIPRSPPNVQIANLHPLAKNQSSISNMQPQTANIHPQAQGQPSVSLQSQVQGQPLVSTSRHMQGQPTVSAIHRQSLGHPAVPNIHPQAQGQPQVHTGNLPLHTHIPVGSPQVARTPSASLQSYAMSAPRSAPVNTSRLLFANRENSAFVKMIEKTNRDSVHRTCEKSNTSSSTPSDSTPDSNPFPSPPSSSDGKTKHLINPFTGQLEPMPSDDDEEEESIGSLPPFPDFEIDTSENGQSERSLSDGGKDNIFSSDTDSGISKSHTDISQSSTECGPIELGKESKKSEMIAKIEAVPTASVTSSVPGEKLKLRLKIDPKTIRESKETEIKEKKAKECNTQINQKIDVALVNIPGLKKNVSLGSASSAPEPRVPPLHISLRGPNAAVVVSPRKDDTKSRYFGGKDDHSGSESCIKISQKKARSPRSARMADLSSFGSSGVSRTLESAEKKGKNSSVKDPKKAKDDYWNQNVKNMSGGGIVEMSEKMSLNRVPNYETYLANVTVGASSVHRKTSVTSLGVRDSCKSEIMTLTSCATGESVRIHTGSSSKSPLPLQVTSSEIESFISVSTPQTFIKSVKSNVHIVESPSERTANSVLGGNGNQEKTLVGLSGGHAGSKKDESLTTGMRNSPHIMQNNYLPHSPIAHVDSRNCIKKVTCPNDLQSPANCVSVASTVPPSPRSVCINSTPVRNSSEVVTVSSAVSKQVSVLLDANRQSPVEKDLTMLASNVTNSDKHQTSNQCNTHSTNTHTETVKNTPLAVAKIVQNEKPFLNSHPETLHNKDKHVINEVQINVAVNRDQTANNFDGLRNEVNNFNDKNDIVEKTDLVSSVTVKQTFHDNSDECKTTVFSNHNDTCKSSLTSLVSVTKREIIKEVVEASEKGLCLIEVKKPPIAQIITVDSLPIQSRVIEVPSLQTSLAVPKTLAKSGLALEVGSIPSLIPSHGDAFLPARNMLLMQESRDIVSLGGGRDSPDLNQTRMTSACLESFSKSSVPCNTDSGMQMFNHINLKERSAPLKSEDDATEQNSSALPSEESSMDSIDEERKRCMLVSEVRTSTPGPPSDAKNQHEGSNTPSNDIQNTEEKISSLSVGKIPDTSKVEQPLQQVLPPEVTTSQVDTCKSVSADLSVKGLTACIPAPIEIKNENEKIDRLLQSNLEPSLSFPNNHLLDAKSSAPEAPSNNFSERSTSDSHSSNLCNSQKNPLQSSTESEQSTPCDKTTNLIKIENSEPSSNLDKDATLIQVTTSDQIKKETTPICEPSPVVCTATNSVVTSLLSQGRYLSPEVGASGRVRLILKGSNSPTSVVVPLNSSKTVPIKLVTLPGGASGLSVRSTSNPNVVEIIGAKSSSAHNSPSSGNPHSPSPVRLVVSKMPSVTGANQSGGSNVRNRVVVKSVVVTGTSSSIKLVSSTKGAVCTTTPIATTSTVIATSAAVVSSANSAPSSFLNTSTLNSASAPDDETGQSVANSSILHSDDSTRDNKTSSNENNSKMLENNNNNSESPPVSCPTSEKSVECSSTTLDASNNCTDESSSSQVIISTTEQPQPNLIETKAESSESEQLEKECITNIIEASILSLESGQCANSDNKLALQDTACHVLNLDVVEKNNKVNKSDSEETEKITESAITKSLDNISVETKSPGANDFNLNTNTNECLNNADDASNLNTKPIAPCIEPCADSSDIKIEEPCLIEKEIIVESNVEIVSIESDKCADETPTVIEEVVGNCNTDYVEEVLLEQSFLVDSVQNEICISPEVLIKSEDIVDLSEQSNANVEKQPIRPFKEPKTEDEASKCTDVKEEESEESEDIAKRVEQNQLEISLVYSKPLKRKCSENAAELIKACMGVEDSPKRGLVLKQKPSDDLIEKVDCEKIEDTVRMSLRVRRDDTAKKAKGPFSSDCSSDEELALSELVTKSRTRERPSRGRLCARDTPTEPNNCRSARRRSGSNESRQGEETKGRTPRDCKRDVKKEETLKKMPERTKRGAIKVQGGQRSGRVKDQDVKTSVLNSKEENIALGPKRKTRGTGNSETLEMVVPVKRRRYSKDGHR